MGDDNVELAFTLSEDGGLVLGLGLFFLIILVFVVVVDRLVVNVHSTHVLVVVARKLRPSRTKGVKLKGVTGQVFWLEWLIERVVGVVVFDLLVVPSSLLGR